MRTKNPKYIEAIESFVTSFIDDCGRSPTIREIADGTGMSKTNAQDYIAYMREAGMLHSDGTARSIVTKKEKQSRSQMLRVPVLGAVACGVPKFAEENIEEYVKLPVSLFGTGDFYILRADGDSMIEAGIDSGDLVLIKQQNYANEGQIVVALMEDEATLKRFYPEPENHRVRLHPENSTMEDIYVENCIIQGVAVKVLKDLE